MRRSSRRGGAGARGATSALDAGLRLLARRPHSRIEMRAKLARRGYDQAEVDAALARLLELGYLDDRAFATGHVRRRSTALGPLALSAELAARGVERAVAGEALAGFDAEAQLGSATRLAQKLVGRKSFAGYEQLLGSVGPKLVRRGFSSRVARSACQEAWRWLIEGSEAASEAASEADEEGGDAPGSPLPAPEPTSAHPQGVGA